MMAQGYDEILTPKHKRLEKISAAADIFAWIVLVFFLIQAISQYLIFTSQQSFQPVLETYKEYPVSAFVFFLNIINLVFKGVVYWITLKGVSLGLNMIMETDLNYREKVQDESHE